LDADTSLKLAIYEFTAAHARVPTVGQLAPVVGLSAGEVRAGYQRLFASRVLVLEADGETIRMAPPFSGVETQHEVTTDGKRFFANCAWDSLGILAALHAQGEVRTRCEQTREPIAIRVTRDGPLPAECVAHFAVPAARWWQDIVFT
jgi:hypothetical protein